MQTEQWSHGDVAAFLTRRHGDPQDLVPLEGGTWSSAWGYRADGQDLVVRFGPEKSFYEAERLAMAFASPDLPVPEVKEIGTTPSGQAYAISTRHYGLFLEDTPVDQAETIAPTLSRLLVALFNTPAPANAPVQWHPAAGPAQTWREYVLSGLVDDPRKVVHGWGHQLAADPKFASLAAAVTERVTTLVEACPERRDLIHGDLLHGNVLVSHDLQQVKAVLSWKASVRGDFLFDTAWCSYFAPLYPGIAAALPMLGLLQHPTVQSDPTASLDAAARHHCYELHVGYSYLGWYIWTADQPRLTATAQRLADILDRGPYEHSDVDPLTASTE